MTVQNCVPIVGMEENNMIKNIIFDIGNVLAGFAWKEYFAGFGYEDAVLERLAKATTLSAQWAEFDRAVLSDEEVFQLFITNDPEMEPYIRETLTHVPGLVSTFDYAIPWVQELKANGYNVYYLSNFPRTARTDCDDALGFVQYMDGGIFSFELNLIKPDAAIYHALLERYQLNPDECVFFDDVEKNVKAACEVGIHGVLFENKKQAMEELGRLNKEK